MRTRRWFWLTGLFFLLLVPAAGAGDLDAFQGQQGSVKIAGGTAHIATMKEAAKAITAGHPQVQITIAGGGTGVGIKQAGEGLIDIGNAGRKPTDEEIATYHLQVVQWAIDGVSPVVNPANTVRQLTSAQLQAIFAGTISNWQEVGGANATINLYDRDQASGTREVFVEKGLKKGAVASRANVVVSNGAMKTAVASDPHGIGYVSVGHIDSGIVPVTLDGVLPSIATVKNGSYPVARGLYSVTKGQPSGLAGIFLDFMLSPSGQQIVTQQGLIPVR